MEHAPEHPPATPSPEPDAGERRRASAIQSTATGVKRALLVVLGALIALFAVFNSRSVEVRWIFGDPISTPLILVIVVSLVAGIVIGWLSAKLRSRR